MFTVQPEPKRFAGAAAGRRICVGAARGAVTILLAMAAASTAGAQPAAPDDAPGWTGTSDPDDVIAGRRGLMLEIEAQMRPIDSFGAGDDADPETLRAAARAIAAMLAATPHLFPPSTNRFDPDAEIPVTLALPAIWQDFRAFYTLASAASDAAMRVANAESAADLAAAGAALRGTCDACHGVYMYSEAYTPPSVSDEDLDFDFDSLFEGSLE